MSISLPKGIQVAQVRYRQTNRLFLKQDCKVETVPDLQLQSSQYNSQTFLFQNLIDILYGILMIPVTPLKQLDIFQILRSLYRSTSRYFHHRFSRLLPQFFGGCLSEIHPKYFQEFLFVVFQDGFQPDFGEILANILPGTSPRDFCRNTIRVSRGFRPQFLLEVFTFHSGLLYVLFLRISSEVPLLISPIGLPQVSSRSLTMLIRQFLTWNFGRGKELRRNGSSAKTWEKQ